MIDTPDGTFLDINCYNQYLIALGYTNSQIQYRLSKLKKQIENTTPDTNIKISKNYSVEKGRVLNDSM